MNNELTAMIDLIVTEKTFTMDALEAIQALKVKAEQLEQKNETLTADLSKEREIKKNLSEQLSTVKSTLLVFQEREQAVANREAQVTNNEKRAAVAEAVSAAYKDALKTVFAPNVVRNAVQSYGSLVQNGNSYPTSGGSATTTAEGYDTSGYTGASIQTNL